MLENVSMEAMNTDATPIKINFKMKVSRQVSKLWPEGFGWSAGQLVGWAYVRSVDQLVCPVGVATS